MASNRKNSQKKGLITILIIAVLVLAVCVVIGIMGKTADVMENKIEQKTLIDTDVQIGDTITLGHYEQDNDTANGAEKIEWIVLDKQDGRIFVISKYALDCRQYHEKEEAVTWETCDLRVWLNKDFMNSALTSEEQALIPEVTVTAAENPAYGVYGVYGGNDTKDHIFVLSIDDTDKYSDVLTQTGACFPTKYTISKGAFYNLDDTCYWWLRSPGGMQSMAAYMCASSLSDFGRAVSDVYAAVRPAMWIELD